MKNRYVALAFAISVFAGSIQSAHACTSPENSQLYAAISSDIDDIFYNRPKRLHERGVLSDAFLASIEGVELKICDDARYDARVGGDGSVVILDVGFVEVMFFGSASLIVGQFLNSQSDQVGVLDLFEAWHIQSIPLLAEREMSLPFFMDVASKLLGTTVDLSKYPPNRNLNFDIAGPFVHALGFILNHEVCHIALGHIDEIRNPNVAVPITRRSEMEQEADICAIEMVNRDEEAVGGVPGLNLLGAAAALGMRIALEARQETDGKLIREITAHLKPAERLDILAKAIFDDLDRRGLDSPITRSTLQGVIHSSKLIAQQVVGDQN
ncbi:hypothetical protein EBB79_15035 [Parasedimentitalea marina]|uniref:Peptidase M48 domain-containing protein n=1 Tax=Parasedimentitalea marina TaxID=2483033 RepID=A0A3T0N4V1_9RHOB|nr:hypothetical protein [Parasedimentitalea marina]AZV79056.1 hypothetical protein EBB79_15035 [Parasedimentitalea marina]